MINEDVWTIKYRPQKLDDIIGNKPIISSIKSMMPNIPHMLFKGTAGVGKTTTALAIVNELDCQYKEINASDDNGIDVIRETVKNFANTKSLNGNFKVIILDEADALTQQAQTAFRRTMEKYTHNCRFILTCNFPQKIIDPIHSRCSGGNFEFLPIQFDEFNIGISKILEQEEMIISPDAISELYRRCKGDMRIVDTLYQISKVTKNITLDHIITSNYDESHKELFKFIKSNNYLTACKFAKKDHIVPLFDQIINDDTIDSEKKRMIIKHFAEWDYRKNSAITERIQLYSLISSIIDVLKNGEEQKIKGNPFK